MSVNAAFQRDENFVPITNLGFLETKTIEYSALTTGAIGATTLFNVEGTVAVNVFGFCTESLAGTGTIEIGVSGATATLCNQHTATDIDVNEVWHNGVLAVAGQVGNNLHIVNQDIIQTIASNTVTDGTITFYCGWVPVTEGALVTAA